MTDGRPESVREVETKFDVPAEFEVPNLARFIPKDGRIDHDTVQLSSTYYDISALTLMRFHLTLRRRKAIGDTIDVGWQLKVPGAGFRTELHWPADDNDAPPAAMVALLWPFLNNEAPVAAIRLDVTRARHRIIDAEGRLRAEIAHDDVTAVALAAAVRASHWPELEIELGEAGTQSLLARLDRAVRKAGARPSTSRSKLARAVNGIGDESVGTDHTSAGAVLSDYLAVQADALISGHFAIDQDVDDSVHQTRVACRRFRSVLRTFANCYDEDAAAALDGELAWYAGELGSVRDLEVLRTRMAESLAALPPSLVVGAIAAHLDARLAEHLAAARAGLLATQHGERYAALLARVVDWRDDPPFRVDAGRPAATLNRALRRAETTLAKRLATAASAAGTDPQMHAARKAGKRARYAAEAVRRGKSSGRARRLQDLLGEFQDSVIAADAVQRLAAEASANGEDTFTYGVLYARERAQAAALRERVRRT